MWRILWSTLIMTLNLQFASGQFSEKYSYIDDIEFGIKGEINYAYLTNGGGSGIDWAIGIFGRFPIGSYVEIQPEFYYQAVYLNYQFHYTYQSENETWHVKESGKERIMIAPVALVINYSPGNDSPFSVGLGYSFKNAFVEKVDGEAPYTGTGSNNQPISGTTFPYGTRTQYDSFYGSLKGLHGVLLDVGYTFKSIRGKLRLQYTLSNFVIKDQTYKAGNTVYEYYDYPEQHLIIVGVGVDVDIAGLIKSLVY